MKWHERTADQDIRYRRPLNYQHFQILGWLCVVASQLSLILNLALSLDMLSPDLEWLLADMGEGLLITELGGLHAGANPVSGDFSLIAKGFRVKDGKQGAPVEQVTIAGNFYQLLKDIRAVGSDLEFKGSGIGSPSVDAGTIHVAGK